MPGENLFTMLSSYRPGAAASPFENYCTSGLAYFLSHGHTGLAKLMRSGPRPLLEHGQRRTGR